ncbi:riboflavin synthase subunit alpha [Candidatus Erwinia haradaeae]|uniref:Riboflavin synthase n=1 Tax=Candidatus Erwinia haradaeae TaxID=1922217 RepID=A0A451DIL1_9GAMM|nr:riboflavin synthase subunit alpha [Candidatus Erwinia haradaeae]VFP86508.1 Riboflavin synthase [Candidatus Erwinia haradaeae]
MFTGIVQGIAELYCIQEEKNIRTYIFKMPSPFLEGLQIGYSVANNGCCLTVTKITGDHVSFDLVTETLLKTNLGVLNVGDTVNIERAAKFSDEIGGHFVSGHIMSTAIITRIYNKKSNYTMWLTIDFFEKKKYIFYKGFITIDGISLTVGEVTQKEFCVHLVPETLLRTTLGQKNIGCKVNIEFDLNTQVIVDTIERVLMTR